MPYTDSDLIRLQAEALFVHDASGRLLRVNEPDPAGTAPRFFLSRSRAGHLWRVRHDLPPDLAAALQRLAADEPISDDLTQPPLHAAQVAALLEQHAPVSETYAGPAYYLPDSDLVSNAVAITPENIFLLQAHFSWLYNALADYAPVAAVVADGQAAAVCFCARITARVAEAGVYTAEQYRGRGFATDAVRGWAAALRASGRLPLYSTTWENRASQAIARKFGAVQYGVEFALT